MVAKANLLDDMRVILKTSKLWENPFKSQGYISLLCLVYHLL